jgi:Zn-dependent protease
MLGWSIRLGSLLGVPVFVHWTFLLLVGWLMAGPFMAGAPNPVAAGLRAGGFVLAVFGCVLLHEMGHALAARRYGIRTRDIVLLPIGGVARLESMPRKPVQELVVAVAGPAVNVVIAALIIPAVLATQGAGAFAPPAGGRVDQASFLASLGAVNVMLVAFNAIPAFPMDGGRVLRAVLAMFVERATATRIAASVGQVVAVLLAVFGLFTGQYMLLLIALFVFMAAGAEARAEQFASVMRGVPVWRAMMTRFVTLRASQTLGDAARELLAGSQQDFLVLADDAAGDDDATAIAGVLTRHDLARGLAAGREAALVQELMRPACPSVREQEDLQSVLDRLYRDGRLESGECPVIPVVRPEGPRGSGGRIVGLITPENLTELVMVLGAPRGGVPAPPPVR